MRLDNVVYRLGLAVSRAQARQIVSHGGILVNGKKVNIPSYQLREGDKVEPKNKDKYAEIKNSGVPSWIEFDAKKVIATIKHLPLREEIDTSINENLIIEFYSR
jgi:small subunit ribosomal protein S4